MNNAYALWRRIDRPGHDAARLARAGEGWRLDGFAAFHENGPTGLNYEVELAADSATVAGSVVGHREGRLFHHEFRRTGAGWLLDDEAIPGLVDVLHLDFGFTPATNLAQLLHANLSVGEDAEIAAAWFDVSEGTLLRLPQHYRRVAPDRYHYHSPTAGYEGMLEMAACGFVRRYPGLWEMVHDV